MSVLSYPELQARWCSNSTGRQRSLESHNICICKSNIRKKPRHSRIDLEQQVWCVPLERTPLLAACCRGQLCSLSHVTTKHEPSHENTSIDTTSIRIPAPWRSASVIGKSLNGCVICYECLVTLIGTPCPNKYQEISTSGAVLALFDLPAHVTVLSPFCRYPGALFTVITAFTRAMA
jgi:hypothetical protein